MNVLPREKQMEVIAALCDGLGIRAVSRITGVSRGTVAALALRIGRGCAELHDRMMVGLHVNRLGHPGHGPGMLIGFGRLGICWTPPWPHSRLTL